MDKKDKSVEVVFEGDHIYLMDQNVILLSRTRLLELSKSAPSPVLKRRLETGYVKVFDRVYFRPLTFMSDNHLFFTPFNAYYYVDDDGYMCREFDPTTDIEEVIKRLEPVCEKYGPLMYTTPKLIISYDACGKVRGGHPPSNYPLSAVNELKSTAEFFMGGKMCMGEYSGDSKSVDSLREYFNAITTLPGFSLEIVEYN